MMSAVAVVWLTLLVTGVCALASLTTSVPAELSCIVQQADCYFFGMCIPATFGFTKLNSDIIVALESILIKCHLCCSPVIQLFYSPLRIIGVEPLLSRGSWDFIELESLQMLLLDVGDAALFALRGKLTLDRRHRHYSHSTCRPRATMGFDEIRSVFWSTCTPSCYFVCTFKAPARISVA